MAFCVKCGKQINENTTFCPNCGNKIGKKVVVSNNSNLQRDTVINRNQDTVSNSNQYVNQTNTSRNNLNQESNNQILKDKTISLSINREVKRSSLIALASSIVLAISTVLPIMTLSVSENNMSLSLNISLMDISKIISLIRQMVDGLSSNFVSGIILLILAIATMVVILMQKEELKLILGAITGAVGLYEIYSISSVFKLSSNVLEKAGITKGYGYYLILLSSIVLLVAVGIDFYNTKYSSNK